MLYLELSRKSGAVGSSIASTVRVEATPPLLSGSNRAYLETFLPDRFQPATPDRGAGWSTKMIVYSVLTVMPLAVSCGADMDASPNPAAPAAATQPVRPIKPMPVSAEQTARLPRATTFTRLRGAPKDTDSLDPGDGAVTHPTEPQIVYAHPGGPPVAVLPTTEMGSATWVPIVQTQPGWVRVLLPSRPNKSTGWIYSDGGGLQNAYSPYRVEIELSARRLTLFKAGHRLRSWTVAVGAADTPTPTGRTFLLAALSPPKPTYTPLILPLGMHSTSLDSFDGGPSTIALHGWPDKSVFGRDISHGCVRIPSTALRVLSRIPLGSSVLITA
ncbi:L,D-transpeptidase [Nonomuraea sp. LPB2021202275-12-8]|uniref:L,D-transpeptidase n=1 Tax=Nonomuraea sp. LPB2021202275-12-8 TaxID=3120159 RepID=UPI00300D2CFF